MAFAATSTAVERLFSQGRQLLHFTRNRLSPDTMCSSLCFGDWCRRELVDMAGVIATIHKSHLGRKRVDSESEAESESCETDTSTGHSGITSIPNRPSVEI